MSTTAEAMALAETKFADYFFTFGRGQCRSSEPLYGFALFAPALRAAEGTPILEAEHDDPVECIRLAITAFDQLPY